MLIDPHVNPNGLTPEELIDKMIEASMDGAVITCTHSAEEAKPYLRALLDDEFTCFVGVELKTEHGDLVFIPSEADEEFFGASWGPTEDQRFKSEDEDLELWSEEALREKLSQFEGALIICHPYSRLSGRSWGDRAFTLADIDAVETRVGRGLPHRDYLCDQIAEMKGWSRVGSSSGDCHFIGSAATVFSEDVETQAQLCEALSVSLCWPIEFEDPMFPRARYQGVVADEGPRRQTLEERERKAALNELDRRRGYEVDEPIQNFKPGGRWGRGSKTDHSPRSGRSSHSSRGEGGDRSRSHNKSRTSNRS